MPAAAMAAPASPARRPRTTPTSWSSWTATAPTIRRAIAALVGADPTPATTISSSARARAASAKPGSMAGHQLLAGLVAGALIGLLYGVRYTDMCAFRAIRRETLLALGMRE